jgi:hypothetical protein
MEVTLWITDALGRSRQVRVKIFEHNGRIVYACESEEPVAIRWNHIQKARN